MLVKQSIKQERKMNIIRDEELGGLMMIPLFQQWNVKRCNIKGCTEKTNNYYNWN